MIDFLFFTPHEKKICIYVRKNGQTPELARGDWLESLLAEEGNVTVVVNHFLLLRLDMSLKKKKKTHKTLLLLRFVPDSFKANNEHFQKKKKWTFVLKSLRGH